jgi:crotonobetainyl-CoA hydratase
MGSEAVLGLPEVKRGLIAGGGGAIRLPRQTPIKIAKELSLLGDFVDSDQALRWGLVNRVVADEDVLDAAVAMARVIAANAPLAVQATKRLMDASSSSREAMRELWRQNQSESESVMASADHAEGALAFVERRPPIWSGT